MIYFDTSQNNESESFAVNVSSGPVKRKKKEWNGPFPKGSPEETLNTLLRQYKEIDDIGHEIRDLSAACYDDLQYSITSMKEYTRLMTTDESDNANILAEVRCILSNSMENKTQQFTDISQLTTKFRSKARLLTQKSDLVIDPKHRLPNIEKCFQTMLSVYRKQVHLAKKLEKSVAKVEDYSRDFVKKLSMLRCWVKRWRSAVADIEADRYNLSVLTMRHKLMATFDLENKEMKEELQHTEILYDALSDADLSQEDKCDNEDKFVAVIDEYQVLLNETADAKEHLERLEGEARDLDSLFVEESTLLQNIEDELKEFYEYFSKRPVIKYGLQAKRMIQYATTAMAKLSSVADELDAVSTIQEIKDTISSKHRIPFNVYTSHTLKAAVSHWERTMQSASEAMQWAEIQAKIASQLDAGCTGNFEKQLQTLAQETRELVTDIIREIKGRDGKGVKVDKTSAEHKANKYERIFAKLVKMRKDKTDLIVEAASPLHKKGQTTPQVIDLMNCWNHCIFTMLVLLDDVMYQINLIDLDNPTMEDMVKRKILLNQSSEFYSNLGTRVLCVRENVKMSENDDLVFLPPTKAAAQDISYKSDLDSALLQYSSKLDPYGRITCAGWLDIVYKLSNPDIRVPTLLLKRQELETNFNLLVDGKPFITQKSLKRLTRQYAGLWDYCQKHMTEHFGPESERYAKKGITCYDYKRFICKLLGLRRKLSVNPN